VRHLKSRLPLLELLRAVCTMTMHELNRPKDKVVGDVIREGAGVDCQDAGEVSNGIL